MTTPRTKAIFDAIREDGATDWPDGDIEAWIGRCERNLRENGFRIVSTKLPRRRAGDCCYPDNGRSYCRVHGATR